MFLGVLQFELIVHDSRSLKDKRRVVKSVKDRLHREHLVSVAEIAALENLNLAIMGIAMVSNSKAAIGRTFDRIVHKLRGLHDAELGELSRQLMSGSEIEDESYEEPWAGGAEASQ
ncbi:MAG: DUF503 domain-containing protein [Planctomycetota bacterium]|nr:DUF503 domain-containing protein [Planctomycetota bacterium]